MADTQVLIWYVLDPGRLTSEAVEALEAATNSDHPVFVSAYSLIEIVSAVEKATKPLSPG